MTPIHNITFSFNEAEDRITLRCTLNDQSVIALLLTRRLTGPLLEKLTKMLLKTSEMAATLPTKLREEVIMMEHAHALARIAAQVTESGAGAQAADSDQEEPADHLLTRIDFQPQADSCTLLFFCNGSDTVLTAITFNRVQLHWFVDTLDRFAQRAGWEIRPHQRDWLALKDSESAAAPNRTLLH